MNTTTAHSPSKAKDNAQSELSFRETARLIFKIIQFSPKAFILACVLFALFHLSPFAMAYLVSLVFEQVNLIDTTGVTQSHLTLAWLAIGTLLLVRGVRYFVFYEAIKAWIYQMYLANTLVRANLLNYLLTAPNSRQLSDTPSEAVSRFRDDVNEIGIMCEDIIDFFGMIFFTTIALIVMSAISPTLMLFVYAPMFLVVVMVRMLSPTIRRYRRKMRQAEARVTDFIGESFSAINSVKLAAKEPEILTHMMALGDVRQKAALKDTLVTELITSITRNMMRMSTGFLLLAGAYLIQKGKMNVEDIVLVIGLLPMLMFSTQIFAQIVTQQRRVTISFERFQRLLTDAKLDDMVKHTPLYMDTDAPKVEVHRKHAPLERLLVRGLGVTYDNGEGINDISLSVDKGEFVVITGRMGSGKSTLVKALLGLIKQDAGDVFWNGERVIDPASFFVPPRSAYTSQLPNLFSDSLQENILMGESDHHLDTAIELAVLKPDLAEMPNDLLTEVGARGVKLSGGQVQRTAIARMLAIESDLLVFDDVSSALDASTEQQLWQGLFSARDATCLVVSHRRPALQRADKILLMEEGRVLDSGTLDELLERQPLMRTIWADETESF